MGCCLTSHLSSSSSSRPASAPIHLRALAVEGTQRTIMTEERHYLGKCATLSFQCLHSSPQANEKCLGQDEMCLRQYERCLRQIDDCLRHNQPGLSSSCRCINTTRWFESGVTVEVHQFGHVDLAHYQFFMFAYCSLNFILQEVTVQFRSLFIICAKATIVQDDKSKSMSKSVNLRGKQ